MSDQSLTILENELDQEKAKDNKLRKIKDLIHTYDPVFIMNEKEKLNKELRELEKDIWDTFSPRTIHDIDNEYLDIYIPVKQQYDYYCKKLNELDSKMKNLQIPKVIEVTSGDINDNWYSYFVYNNIDIKRGMSTCCIEIEKMIKTSEEKCLKTEKMIQNEKLKFVDTFLEHL